MRKGILVFALLIIFLAFSVFLINAYLKQKNYSKNLQNNSSPEPLVNDVVEKTMPSVYTEYSKDTFDKAQSFRQVVVLYFTSNWCQECIKQDQVNTQAFEGLPKEGVIGLKVHILDSETTIETDALAKKFDVTKEQSFVILDKNGAVFFRFTGNIDKDLLNKKILEVR